jgi:tetratricopeptide (TPR) repeat protein
MRILESIPNLIEKGDYSQAFEKAEKAKKLAEKAKAPALIQWSLMAKGETLGAAGRLEEAIETFEKALELSSDLFLEAPENLSNQENLYDNIGKLGKTLNKLDNVTKAQQVCKKAEKFFEKILAAYENLLANNPENSEYLSSYLSTIGNIWTCYLIAEDLEKQIPLVPSIVQTYEKVIESDPENPKYFLRLDGIVKKFGRTCLEKGLFDEAKKVYEQVHTVFKNIYKKYPENRLALNFLLLSYEYFANLYAKINENERVENYYSQALELAEEQLQKDPQDFLIIMSQGKIYQDLGVFNSDIEELEKAKFYYEKALVNFERLIGKNLDDVDFQYNLVGIFNRLAGAFEDISIVEKAKECYLHEIDIYEFLIESEIDEIENKLNIAETFDQIASLYAEDEDTESAKEYYEKEMEIYRKLLSEFPGENEYELCIAETFNELGDLYFEIEEIPARQYYEKALVIAEKALEQAPSDTLLFSNLLVDTLSNLAELNRVYHHYETAILFQQRVLDLQLEIQKKFPKNVNQTQDLGNAFSELGLLFEKVGDMKQAEQLHSRAVETFSEVLFGREDPSAKRILATEIQLRGYAYLRSKRYLSAKPYLELANKYYESACEEEPNNSRNLEGLFSILYETGLLHYGMKNFEEVIESYKNAFLILDRLTELSPEKFKPQAESVKLYIGFGMSYSALNELEKSGEAFEKALALNTELLKTEPKNIFFLEDKAITLGEYANLLLKMGRTTEAEAYKAESAELYQKIDSDEPNLMKFRSSMADI